MAKPNILLHLDADSQVSSFDSIVALDAGVDQLLRHSGVTTENVEALAHGAMFTRGGDDLKSTAIFVGGSDVERAESIMQKVLDSFFGPVRVSVMADPNGANTTAAAAVICAEKHRDWAGKTIAVLAGTGPVGQRIAQIIGQQSESVPSSIRIVSRTLAKAKKVCARLSQQCKVDFFEPHEARDASANLAAVAGADFLFSAGAAGVSLLAEGWLDQVNPGAIAIDLNAIPPAGIQGVEVTDRGQQRGTAICFGAIGVGSMKMKIHKHCVRSLFEANDKVLDVDQIYRLGKELST